MTDQEDPFRPFPNLINSGYEDTMQDIMALKEDPDLLVRIQPGKFETLPLDHPDAQVVGTQYEYQENKTILRRLQDQYSIAVPRFDVLIVPESDTESIFYVVTDRIHGPNLKDKIIKPNEAQTVKDKVDALYSSLAQYFFDVYTHGGWYIYDITKDNTQFVYGRKKGDIEDKIYLVDVGPSLDFLDKEDHGTHRDFFNYAFRDLYTMIEEMEIKLGSKLVRARKRLLDFAEAISPSHKDYARVEKVRENLKF